MAELFSMQEFVKVIGFPGLIFIIWYLFWRGEKQKWELQLEQLTQMRLIQKEKEDADRKEHMHKWDALISNHKLQIDQLIQSHDAQMQQLVSHYNKQLERNHSISDRQSQAIELTAEYLHKLITKIDTIKAPFPGVKQ